MFVVILFVCLFSCSLELGWLQVAEDLEKGKMVRKGKRARTIVFINWFVLLMLWANRGGSDPMESTEEMTITTKDVDDNNWEIEEMWSARAARLKCVVFNGRRWLHVFSLVCRRIRFHLSFSTSSNQSSSWTDKTEKKRETAGFFLSLDIVMFVFVFFSSFLCVGAHTGLQSNLAVRRFSTRRRLFFFLFFFLHKENTRMENRSCSAHTVYIL